MKILLRNCAYMESFDERKVFVCRSNREIRLGWSLNALYSKKRTTIVLSACVTSVNLISIRSFLSSALFLETRVSSFQIFAAKIFLRENIFSQKGWYPDGTIEGPMDSDFLRNATWRIKNVRGTLKLLFTSLFLQFFPRFIAI